MIYTTEVKFLANDAKEFGIHIPMNPHEITVTSYRNGNVTDAKNFERMDIRGMTEYVFPGLDWEQANEPLETIEIVKLLAKLD